MYEQSFVCPEPGGDVTRHVRPLAYSDIPRVYTSLRASLLGRGRELPPELAMRELMRLDKLYWTVDDVGIIIASEAGDVHVFFWDRRLRGRERLCQIMAEQIMNILGRSSVWTQIPLTERAVIAFAKRVGFQEEASPSGYTVLRLKRG